MSAIWCTQSICTYADVTSELKRNIGRINAYIRLSSRVHTWCHVCTYNVNICTERLPYLRFTGRVSSLAFSHLAQSNAHMYFNYYSTGYDSERKIFCCFAYYTFVCSHIVRAVHTQQRRRYLSQVWNRAQDGATLIKTPSARRGHF